MDPDVNVGGSGEPETGKETVGKSGRRPPLNRARLGGAQDEFIPYGRWSSHVYKGPRRPQLFPDTFLCGFRRARNRRWMIRHAGRGFVACFLHESGYEVVFVDVNHVLIDQLNSQPTYRVVEVGAEGTCEKVITNYRAINSRTHEHELI